MTDFNQIIDDDFGTNVTPQLYGKMVILWFSFLFSPLVGGVLMLINLLRLKRSKFAYTVFLASLAYSLATFYLGFVIEYEVSGRLMILILNLVGGNLLSGSVWKNTIGSIKFSASNPWIAFAVVLIIYIGVGLASYLAMSPTTFND